MIWCEKEIDSMGHEYKKDEENGVVHGDLSFSVGREWLTICTGSEDTCTASASAEYTAGVFYLMEGETRRGEGEERKSPDSTNVRAFTFSRIRIQVMQSPDKLQSLYQGS